MASIKCVSCQKKVKCTSKLMRQRIEKAGSKEILLASYVCMECKMNSKNGIVAKLVEATKPKEQIQEKIAAPIGGILSKVEHFEYGQKVIDKNGIKYEVTGHRKLVENFPSNMNFVSFWTKGTGNTYHPKTIDEVAITKMEFKAVDE